MSTATEIVCHYLWMLTKRRLGGGLSVYVEVSQRSNQQPNSWPYRKLNSGMGGKREDTHFLGINPPSLPSMCESDSPVTSLLPSTAAWVPHGQELCLDSHTSTCIGHLCMSDTGLDSRFLKMGFSLKKLKGDANTGNYNSSSLQGRAYWLEWRERNWNWWAPSIQPSIIHPMIWGPGAYKTGPRAGRSPVRPMHSLPSWSLLSTGKAK